MNDFYADSILSTVFKSELESSKTTKEQTGKKITTFNFEQNLISSLSDIYDGSSIDRDTSGNVILNLDGKIVRINMTNLLVKCEEDEALEQNVSVIIKQLKDLS